MPRPFPEAPSFGGPTDSSHYDCRLRGKGQPLEGDLEQTSLTTKSRWGFEPVFEPEPGRVFNHAEARTASRALADLCPRNAGMNRRAQRSSHAAMRRPPTSLPRFGAKFRTYPSRAATTPADGP